MELVFPAGSFTVQTGDGLVMMRACELCGAVVVEAEDSDYAMHLRWHEVTGSANWLDSVERRARRPR